MFISIVQRSKYKRNTELYKLDYKLYLSNVLLSTLIGHIFSRIFMLSLLYHENDYIRDRYLFEKVNQIDRSKLLLSNKNKLFQDYPYESEEYNIISDLKIQNKKNENLNMLYSYIKKKNKVKRTEIKNIDDNNQDK